jgi:hypothetical protein
MISRAQLEAHKYELVRITYKSNNSTKKTMTRIGRLEVIAYKTVSIRKGQGFRYRIPRDIILSITKVQQENKVK